MRQPLDVAGWVCGIALESTPPSSGMMTLAMSTPVCFLTRSRCAGVSTTSSSPARRRPRLGQLLLLEGERERLERAPLLLSSAVMRWIFSTSFSLRQRLRLVGHGALLGQELVHLDLARHGARVYRDLRARSQWTR